MAEHGRRGPSDGRRGASGGRDRRGSAPRRESPRPGRRGGRHEPPQERSAEQQRYDGPPLPEDVSARDLDPSVRRQLRTLPEKLADRVARHLVAAGRLLDTDPETAYRHTLAARGRATRLAIVREACGEAAYHAEHYAEALTELRAARRMNGSADYLPVMADCERALGRPERALSLAKDPAVDQLDPDNRIEMVIVAAGARRDLAQPEMAVRLLEGEKLHSRGINPATARLRYAYADALLAAGRQVDAVEWFHRAAAVDAEQVTDAAERLAELEGMVLTDLESADPDEDGGRS
jgi:tetratricopeptide (TPR) repeat protein